MQITATEHLKEAYLAYTQMITALSILIPVNPDKEDELKKRIIILQELADATDTQIEKNKQKDEA